MHKNSFKCYCYLHLPTSPTATSCVVFHSLHLHTAHDLLLLVTRLKSLLKHQTAGVCGVPDAAVGAYIDWHSG